jgi:hypothetical protein|tara:strand:+ start:36003 stop:36242 length:240 start_codon:yes stop_codon:yes gene_type:complete
MDPTQILKIVRFIKGSADSSLVVESTQHAKPLADVLFESSKLYNMLQSTESLDNIVEQISRKNLAAKNYFLVTGKKWLF